jgi:Domain of unknown function (DUF1707)
MELRGSQQVGVGVTHLGDAGAAGVHLGQQGPTPKRVVHHLSLQSHGDQSTSASLPPRRDYTAGLRRSPSGLRRWQFNSYDHRVATRQTAGTRAKDSDRNDTCRILDNALSEGQLSMTEHGERVKAATNAATLGELQHLVSDLQNSNSPVQLPSLKKRPRLPGAGSSRGIGIAIAAVLVVLGIAIGWGLYGNTSSPLSFQTDPGAKSDGIQAEVLTPPRQLLSLGGINGLFEQMRKKFGNTMGFNLDIRADSAYLRIPDPRDGRRTLQYMYRGGWEDDPSDSTTEEGARTIDLAKFDVTKIVAILRGAPETVNIQPNEAKDVRLDISPSEDPLTPDEVKLMIYVDGEFANGHFTITPDGTLKDIYPAD